MISVGSILLMTSTLLQAQGNHGDCDPNIPSRPVPLPSSFNVDFDGIKPTVCGEGEYLDWFECKPCEDGTFMTPTMAKEGKHIYCEKCYETKMYEIVTVPCTNTRDASIMCEDGYYRSDVPGKPCQSECRRCDVCGMGRNMFKNYEEISCGGYQNTVCTNGVHISMINFENVHIAPTTSILILDIDDDEIDTSGRTTSYSINRAPSVCNVKHPYLVVIIIFISIVQIYI